MTHITKLLAATAMAVALSGPALALDLNTSTDLGVGITLHDNNRHNGGPGGADLAGNLAVEGNTSAADADSNHAFIGRSVISADGQVIGTVSEQRDNGDATRAVVVTLASGVDGQVRSFALDLAADVIADGDLRIGWTEAELTANLAAQADAQSSDG